MRVLPLVVDPDDRVLHPVLVVALGKSSRAWAPRLSVRLAAEWIVDHAPAPSGSRAPAPPQSVFQISERSLTRMSALAGDTLSILAQPSSRVLLGAEHRAVVLHGAAASRARSSAVPVPPLAWRSRVEAGERLLAGIRQRLVRLARLHHLGGAVAPRRGRTPRGRAASWSPAGWRRAPRRRPPRRSPSGPARRRRDRRPSPSRPRRDSWSGCRPCCSGRSAGPGSALGHVDAGEDPRGLGDAGQALVQHLGVEMLEMQLDVVLVAGRSRGPRGSRSSSSG